MNTTSPNIETNSSKDQIDRGEGDGSAGDVTAVRNNQPSADILKLDIDCFEETFDYLPLKDLVSVGKTCKRLQNVASYCFYQNYSGVPIHFNFEKIEVRTINGEYEEIIHFAPFIRQVEIMSSYSFKTLHKMQSKLQRLKKIKMFNVHIIEADIDRLKNILPRIEVLILILCRGKIPDLINQCPKLKRLHIVRSDDDPEWPIQKCPTLEYFSFTSKQSSSTEGTSILLQNPSIRTFGLTAMSLWANKDAIRTATDIKLDNLGVKFFEFEKVSLDAFYVLLNELHGRGVFKRLHLYFWNVVDEQIDQFSKVNGLSNLYIGGRPYRTELPTLNGIEDLHLRDRNMISLESVPSKLVNLKRAYFCSERLDELMPLIVRSTALKKIKVYELEGGIHFDKRTNVINLLALNELRQQLAYAQKITLYVKEDIYLATKWALKETNFEMIRLRPHESIEWDYGFDFVF